MPPTVRNAKFFLLPRPIRDTALHASSKIDFMPENKKIMFNRRLKRNLNRRSHLKLPHHSKKSFLKEKSLL